jgi:hypothetical protein
MPIITESDRKTLYQSLWPQFQHLPYPRPYRTSLCHHLVSHLCSEMASENPAYSSLAEQLTGKGPNPLTPSLTTL